MALPTSVIRMEKPKRGKARADRQLSKLQRRLLVWLSDEECRLWQVVKGEITPKARRVQLKRELIQRGVPWAGAAKRFYGGSESPPAVSRALKRLDGRGLVIRYDTTGGGGAKRRTSHVRMTRAGEELADFERRHGVTERQREDDLKRWYRERMEESDRLTYGPLK